MTRTSPSEPIHALILAAADARSKATVAAQADPIEAAATIAKWKKLLRSLPTTIRALSGESARFFASAQARIDSTIEAAVVTRQPIQWAAEIVLHRARMWRLVGGRHPPGALAVATDLAKHLNFKGFQSNLAAGSAFAECSGKSMSQNFIDNCITVHDRLIVYPDLVRLVMKHSHVWDRINKLHVLVYKAGNKANMQWVLELLDDALAFGSVEPDEISKSALLGKDQAGLIAFWLAKRLCKDYLLQHAQKTFSAGWQPETFVKIQEVFASIPTFRESMRDLTWQAPMKQSAIRFLEVVENVLVGSLYDESLRLQVNNHRAGSDYIHNMTDLKKDLDEVLGLFNAELEEVNRQARAAVSPVEAPTTAADDEPPAPEKSPMEKLADVWYPKTPFAALGPFIIAAERRVKRTHFIYLCSLWLLFPSPQPRRRPPAPPPLSPAPRTHSRTKFQRRRCFFEIGGRGDGEAGVVLKVYKQKLCLK